MPKLPILTGAEVIRALERLGFSVVRQRGSHIVMRRGTAGCVVPNHREVKFAKGDSDEAAKFYQKAADADPAWGKPWFKLGLVALNKGDKDTAAGVTDFAAGNEFSLDRRSVFG